MQVYNSPFCQGCVKSLISAPPLFSHFHDLLWLQPQLAKLQNFLIYFPTNLPHLVDKAWTPNIAPSPQQQICCFTWSDPCLKTTVLKHQVPQKRMGAVVGMSTHSCCSYLKLQQFLKNECFSLCCLHLVDFHSLRLLFLTVLFSFILVFLFPFLLFFAKKI